MTAKKKQNVYLDEFRQSVAGSTQTVQIPERTSVEDEIAREKKLKNDDIEQNINLKKQTLNRLFILLVVETIGIFVFAYLQATRTLGFQLSEWSFQLLTTVTIVQITVMLSVAVNYLFPKNRQQ